MCVFCAGGNRAVQTQKGAQRDHPDFYERAQEFHDLARDCIQCFILVKAKRSLSPRSRALFDASFKVLEDNREEFESMCSQLKLDDFENSFQSILRDLFRKAQDPFAEEVSWGRIVFVVAFGMHVSRMCHKHNREDVVTKLPQLVLDVVVERGALQWIAECNHGWVSAAQASLCYG